MNTVRIISRPRPILSVIKRVTYTSAIAEPIVPEKNDQNQIPLITEPMVREEWKVISGFPNYEVSTLGRIRNKSGYLFVLKSGDNGYVKVSLTSEDGNRQNKSVHQLVALTFLPNPEGKRVVDHINRQRDDNAVGNLRWATHQENSENSTRPQRVNNGKRILQYTKDNKFFVREWPSISEIVKSTGVTYPQLSEALKSHKRIIVADCLWRYAPDDIEGTWRPMNVGDTLIHLSSCGQVRLPSGKVTRGHADGMGYRVIQLGDKTYRVSRLICQRFNPTEGFEEMCAYHIDGNKENDRADNLVFVTKQENIRRAINGESFIDKCTIV